MLLALAMAVWTTRARTRSVARVPLQYRDATTQGVWCLFDTGLEAMEAGSALNEVYGGSKLFWVEPAQLRLAPDYRGEASVALPEPLPAPRPKTRPKPGTPIVRQVNGQWRVSVGRWTMTYGSGEAGYRAALEAVRQAHQKRQ